MRIQGLLFVSRSPSLAPSPRFRHTEASQAGSSACGERKEERANGGVTEGAGSREPESPFLVAPSFSSANADANARHGAWSVERGAWRRLINTLYTQSNSKFTPLDTPLTLIENILFTFTRRSSISCSMRQHVAGRLC